MTPPRRTSARRIAAWAVGVALLTAACDDGGTEVADAPPSPIVESPSIESSEPETPALTATPSLEPVASALGRCPDAAATVANGELDESALLAGEVDGDGVTDAVGLIVEPSADPRCQAWVVVTSDDDGGLAAPVEEEDLVFDLGLPALERLVSVDNRAGDEILIRVRSGASTQFFVLFTAVDGEPTQVQMAARGSEVPFTFASGGSVGHLDAADCRDDLLVVSSAVLKGNRYLVRRTLYSPGPVLRPKRKERALVRGKELNQFPEFRATPLNSCVLP
jgi:hypothetical protein